ncbi:hypothetical protein AQUCO_00100216v1 [Aquilegia coerulea]|uniref:Uncharacterized protein n=1 Tax=Aquilegia coerulea TaxID=218851 RepID=A0A2G5F9E7_AQUCA|nr:hypothetical protein AQUCO_00100216v1 [Aquilegia coerulea]
MANLLLTSGKLQESIAEKKKKKVSLSDNKHNAILLSEQGNLDLTPQNLKSDQKVLAAEARKLTEGSLQNLGEFRAHYKVWEKAYQKQCSDFKRILEGLELKGNIRVCCKSTPLQQDANASVSPMVANAEFQSVIIPKDDKEMQEDLNQLKVESDIRKRLETVVTEYRNNISIFAGFLSFLYAVTLPCSTVSLCIWLIILGSVGICIFGGLGFYQIHKLGNEVKTVASIYESHNNRICARKVLRKALTISRSTALTVEDQTGNEGLASHQNGENVSEGYGDLETGVVDQHMVAPCHITWLYYLKMAVLLVFSLSFTIFLGIYMHTKTCSAENSSGMFSIFSSTIE